MVTFQHCDELGYSIPKNYSIKLETIVATIKIGFSFFLLIVYFDFFSCSLVVLTMPEN